MNESDIRKIFLDALRKREKLNHQIIQRFEGSIFRLAKTFGVEQEIFFAFRPSAYLQFFGLQSLIYEQKAFSYLDFIKKLKSVGEFILIKGLGIAQKYYKNILGRHVGDIDILVSEKEKDNFVRFFYEEGMKKSRLSEIKKRFGHSEQFFGGGISVGLHTYLCDRFFAEIRYEDVEKEKTLLKIGWKSVEVWTLSKEWDLIELSLHAFQHAFALRILLDIYKVLLSEPNLKNVKFISQSFGLEKMVLIASLSSLKFFSDDQDLIQKFKFEFDFSFLDNFFSDFIASDLFLFDLRSYLYRFPYLDKIFSLFIARRFPVKKVLSIIQYVPKDFIRRFKHVYDTTV